MLPNDEMSLLRENLESKERFELLLSYFITKSIDEHKANEKEKNNNYNYSNLYSKFIDTYARINSDLIFEICQSPIERIFVSSVLLFFIKNGIMGFSITPKLPDIESSIANYRENHKGILKLIKSYKDKTGDLTLENFKQNFTERYIDSGMYTEEDYEEICNHYYIVRNFTYNSFHLTLQPEFPNIKVDNKSIRPDILIW